MSDNHKKAARDKKEVVVDVKTPEGRGLLQDLLRNTPQHGAGIQMPINLPLMQHHEQKQTGITSPDPLVVLLGSEDIFARLDKYDPMLTHQMFELFIQKNQAAVEFMNAQTEAVKSLPLASEREYMITTRGQWLGTACVCAGLILSGCMAYWGHLKLAGTFAMFSLAPAIVSTLISPITKNKESKK